MKIALLGYGKMGKEIEAIALQRHHTIVLKVDETNSASITKADLQQADVAIEFSTPHTVISNIKKCLDAQLPIVIGTRRFSFRFCHITSDKCGGPQQKWDGDNYGDSLICQASGPRYSMLIKQFDWLVVVDSTVKASAPLPATLNLRVSPAFR